jgi:hypothetical protein
MSKLPLPNNDAAPASGAQPDNVSDVAKVVDGGVEDRLTVDASDDQLHAGLLMLSLELVSSVDCTFEFLSSSVDLVDAPPFNFDELP